MVSLILSVIMATLMYFINAWNKNTKPHERKKRKMREKVELVISRTKAELRKSVELDIPDQSEFLKNGSIQHVVWMEEMAELQQAISKEMRGKLNRDNLVEETADVIICIIQLCEENNITAEELQSMINYKHERNLKRQKESDLYD